MSVVLALRKLQKRSQEYTLQKERCARRVAWNLAKFYAQAEQKGFELRWKGHSVMVQTANSGHHGQWRSANIQGSTIHFHDLGLFVTVQLDETQSYRSENSASTTDILWVGWRPKVTVDQNWEDNHLQNRQPLSPCCSRIVNQLRWQCIFKVVAERSVFHRSVKRPTWCRSNQWLSVFQQKPKNKQK